jgi:Gas vesicle protein G
MVRGRASLVFILDSLMISGLRWVLDTVSTAADAEMNDDAALRERLMEAAMRRESGELSAEEFADLEADLLARIREIKERQGGTGALAFGAGSPIETGPESRFEVEATVEGDWDRPGPPARAIRTSRTSRTPRTPRTIRTTRTARATRTKRR